MLQNSVPTQDFRHEIKDERRERKSKKVRNNMPERKINRKDRSVKRGKSRDDTTKRNQLKAKHWSEEPTLYAAGPESFLYCPPLWSSSTGFLS